MNPILALILANIIWGAASPIFKLSLTNIPPFTLAFIRFFFAGLIFLPFVIGKWQKMNSKDFFEILLVGFFGITVNISFFFLGLPRTTSINAPIIASSGPVFLYLMSIFFLKEKPRKRIFWGMMASLLGVLVIIFSPVFFDGKELAFGEIEGNIFFVVATLGSVLQTLVGKKVLQKINPIQVTCLSFFFGSLTFLPISTTELNNWSFDLLNINGWIGIIFGILFSSAIAYYLFLYGIAKIKGQEVGLFTYIDPIVAVVIAIPLLGEYPNIWFIIGSILVFGGIMYAEKRLQYHPIHKLKEFLISNS